MVKWFILAVAVLVAGAITGNGSVVEVCAVIAVAFVLIAVWGKIPESVKKKAGLSLGVWLIVMWLAALSFVFGPFFWLMAAALLIYKLWPAVRTLVSRH